MMPLTSTCDCVYSYDATHLNMWLCVQLWFLSLQVYVKQAKEMGYDAAHLNMRLVQFEYASHRPSANKPPPIFITAIQDNDSAVDK